jgi:hypothetical protein
MRAEVPDSVKKSQTKQYETFLLEGEDTVLTVYQGKPRKNVSVLSTLHHTVVISKGEKNSGIPLNSTFNEKMSGHC